MPPKARRQNKKKVTFSIQELHKVPTVITIFPSVSVIASNETAACSANLEKSLMEDKRSFIQSILRGSSTPSGLKASSSMAAPIALFVFGIIQTLSIQTHSPTSLTSLLVAGVSIIRRTTPPKTRTIDSNTQSTNEGRPNKQTKGQKKYKHGDNDKRKSRSTLTGAQWAWQADRRNSRKEKWESRQDLY